MQTWLVPCFLRFLWLLNLLLIVLVLLLFDALSFLFRGICIRVALFLQHHGKLEVIYYLLFLFLVFGRPGPAHQMLCRHICKFTRPLSFCDLCDLLL